MIIYQRTIIRLDLASHVRLLVIISQYVELPALVKQLREPKKG